MSMGYVTVRFHDEAPSIDSGIRRVLVKRGRKWVHLISPASRARARLLLRDFDRLRPRELEPGADYSLKKLNRRIRRWV
jgi:hypothetical protein